MSNYYEIENDCVRYCYNDVAGCIVADDGLSYEQLEAYLDDETFEQCVFESFGDVDTVNEEALIERKKDTADWLIGRWIEHSII